MRARSVVCGGPGKSGLNSESDVVLEKEQFRDMSFNRLRTGFDSNADCLSSRAKPFKRDGSPSISSVSARWNEMNRIRSGYHRSGTCQTKFSKCSENPSNIEEEDAESIREGSSLEGNHEIERFPCKEFEDGKLPISAQEICSLYALRRNPKPSRRFTDQEFDLDIAAAVRLSAFPAKKADSASAVRGRSCSQCGKMFLSRKALFGHMRCHPERDWSEIQSLNDVEEVEREANSAVKIVHTKRPAAVRNFLQNSEIQQDPDFENHMDGRDEAIPYKTPSKGDIRFTKEEEKQRSKIRRDEKLNQTEEDNAFDKKRGERIVHSKQTAIGGASERNESLLFRTECHTNGIHRVYQKWYQTRKRSKRSKRSRHSVQPLHISTCQQLELESIATPAEIKEDRDMADCLVMLACGGRRLEDMRTKENLSAFSDYCRDKITEVELPTNMEDSEEETVHWIEKVGRAVTAVYDDGLRGDLDGKNRLKDLHRMDSSTTRIKYECSTCKRNFKSHQALGGHRASHKKVKGCFSRPNARGESAEEDAKGKNFLCLKSEKLQLIPISRDHKTRGLQAQVVDSNGRGTVPKKLKGHECSICHRLFASGQALGGHKRCHWTGEKIIADTMSFASSSNKVQWHGRQISRGVIVRDDFFDLNLPTCPDEVEGGMVVDYCVPTSCDSFCNVSEDETETKEEVDCRESFMAANNGYWRREETTQLAGRRGYSFSVLGGEADINGRDFDESIAVATDCHWRGNLEEATATVSDEEGEEGKAKEGSGQKVLQLNWFVHCSICDNSFTSTEALSNHEKVHHTSLMSPAVVGLAPIST